MKRINKIKNKVIDFGIFMFTKTVETEDNKDFLKRMGWMWKITIILFLVIYVLLAVKIF